MPTLVALSGYGYPLDETPALPLPALPSDIIAIYRAGTSGGVLLLNTAIANLFNSNLAFDFLGAIPTASQIMRGVVFTDARTFPANFVGATGKMLSANPTASFVIIVNHNGAQCGTITISTAGVYSFATAGGLAINVVSGDSFDFVAPATPDATALGFLFTLVCQFTP